MSQVPIYIYCVINSTDEINASVDKQQIYSIPWRNQAAVVSDFKKTPDLNVHIKEYAVTHEKVVELMMNRFTVLPMRLLTLVASKEDAFTMMKDNYDDFNANFARLDQKAEFGLKVLWPAEQIKEGLRMACKDNKEDELISGSPAKKFMKKKFDAYKTEKAFQKEAEKYIATIDGFFSGIATEKRLQKLPTDKMLLNASYLVGKNRQDELKPAFEKLRNAQPSLEFQFSGPWPPYNFIVMKKEKASDMESGMSNVIDKILSNK